MISHGYRIIYINIPDIKAKTALIIAYEKGYKDIIDLLEAVSVDAYYDKVEYRSRLMKAIEKKYTSLINFLLSKRGYLSKETRTAALIKAIQCNNNILVKKLLTPYKVDPNSLDNKGKTPLMHACMKRNSIAVKELLRAGANKDIKDVNDRTALMFAKKHGFKLNVAILEGSSIKVYEEEMEFKSKLFTAIKKNNKKIGEELWAEKSLLTKEIEDKSLFIAIWCGQNTLVKKCFLNIK